MISKVVSVITVFFLSTPSFSGELRISGKAIQGGLLFGWTTPESKISLDGMNIVQAQAGDFLVGFPPNAKALSVLKIFYTDGSSERRMFFVKKRNYKIQRIDGLSKRKVTPNLKDLMRIKDERILINRAYLTAMMEPLFKVGFIQPVIGRISGVYGSQRILNGTARRPHYGVDIAAASGTNIKAASAGIVVFVHPGMFFNGKTLVINHGLGLRSTYIHMSAIKVKEGERVSKGQIVGNVGETGRATGPHLHWGLRLHSTPLDPEQLFR